MDCAGRIIHVDAADRCLFNEGRKVFWVYEIGEPKSVTSLLNRKEQTGKPHLMCAPSPSVGNLSLAASVPAPKPGPLSKFADPDQHKMGTHSASPNRSKAIKLLAAHLVAR